MAKRIVLLGAGRVAFHLAKQISKLKGYRLVQVFSRHLETAEALCQSLALTDDVIPIDKLSLVEQKADYYIFALSDAALEDVWSHMPKTEGLWLHTAGSVSVEAMARYHQYAGVFYPLQTFSKERELDWSKVPLYLETLDYSAHDLEDLALEFSENITWLDSRKRAILHCAAVFACNFTNHMIALSEELLQGEGIDAKALLPLIDETFAKIHHLSAKQAQTGPAIRRDQNTMNAHLEALSHQPKLKKIYQLLSDSIQELS